MAPPPPPMESTALRNDQVQTAGGSAPDASRWFQVWKSRQDFRHLEQSREEKVVGRERIAQRYEHIVKSVVMKMSARLPAHVDRDDLVSEGMIGLMDALEKFDRDKGIKFETYAVNRVRGAVLDYLRKIDWAPRSTRKKAKDLDRISAELQKKLQRRPTDEELAARMKVSVHELRDMLIETLFMAPASLEEGWSADDDGLSAMYYLEDENTGNPAQSLLQSEQSRMLLDACHMLPGKEQAIVSLLYGERLTFREIASMLKISISRVSQLHARALMRLRSTLSPVREDLCFE